MNRRVRSYLARFLTLLLSIVAPNAVVKAQNAGRVGAVNPDATGTPPGSGSRMLAIGSNVVYKEKIETTPMGSTQIMFPDQSTLNVGRNSSIVIDEFVYDPNAGTGKMVASVSRGVLRFVGGQISHTAGVTVNTPVGTLGIRGGVASIVYPLTSDFKASDPQNLGNASGELVICNVGTCTIKNNWGTVTLRQGFATYVTGPNDPIPDPFRISDASLQIVMVKVTSGPTQTGGVPNPPTDQMTIRQGYGTTIITPQNGAPGNDPLGYFSIFDGGNSSAKGKSQSGQTTQTAPNY
ncbi:MAG: FecR domain-containing protein [Rhizobiales bacterium]|nr:FecR domain-containing protein [Hyphomicrobiales bacterium]